MRIPWRIKNWWQTVWRRALLRRALRSVRKFPRNRSFVAHSHANELIVSLTSYPPRFSTLALTLKSLLGQRMAADRTILWLAEEDLDQLPANVHELKNCGLEIRTCADLKSYKKLIPALCAFPEAAIVTADDDLYFEPRWLETLVEEAGRYPGSIIAARGHLAQIDASGHLLPYADWEMQTDAKGDKSPNEIFFPTTGAGVLFPPRSLAREAIDASLFQRLAADADDLWVFWMARRKGTPLRRASHTKALLWWDGSQDVGLWHSNLTAGQNDVQAQRLEKHFGPITQPTELAHSGRR